MTHLPGRTVLDDEGLETRLPLLARQLVAVHAVRPAVRPREYVALTTADTVVTPEGADAAVWAAAIDVIRKPAPRYEGRFLHRDFQPGNVLFDLPPEDPAGAAGAGSPASSTGRRPPGARRTSTWRTAPPISHCCTARRGACASPRRTRRPAGCWRGRGRAAVLAGAGATGVLGGSAVGGAAVAGGRTDRADDTSRGGAAGCLCHLPDGRAGLSQGGPGRGPDLIVYRSTKWGIEQTLGNFGHPHHRCRATRTN